MSNLLFLGNNTFDAPLAVPNIRAWWDAADTSTIGDTGGLVDTWTDKSGNALVATGTTTARPTTGVTTSNGKNVLNFNGSNKLVVPSDLFDIPNGSSTVFIVSRINAETGSDQVMMDMTESGGERYLFTYVGSAPTGRLYFQSRTTAGSGVIDTGNTNTDWNVLRARREGVTVAISVNNETETTDVDGQDENGINGGGIGARTNGTNGLNGSIAEIIIYDRSLTAGEMAFINAYLANKWLGFKEFTDIRGLQAYYNTTDDDYLTLDGSAITQFLDLANRGNHTAVQGTASARPTSTANQINGLQAAVFDGNDNLSLPSGLYSIPNGSNTIIIVSKRESEDVTTDSILGFRVSGSAKTTIFYDGTAGIIRYRSNTAATPNVSVSGITNTDFNIITGFRSGTTQSLSVNGGTPSTDANGTDEPAIDAAFVGLGSTGIQLTGSIALILICNVALSQDEIDLAEAKLSTMFNIGLA